MAENKLDQQFILITSSNFPTGGAGANYLNLFCKGLKLNGYSIKVWLLKGFYFGSFSTTHLKNNITEYNVPFTYLGFVSRPRNGFIKILTELIRSFNLMVRLFSVLPERKKTTLLVYNNNFQLNIVIFLFCKLFKIKIVSFVPEFYDKYVFEGFFLPKLKWYEFLFNFFFLNKLSNKLIVFSYYLKDLYLEKGYKESNIIIQPNLTDFDYWEMKNSEKVYTIGYSGSPSLKDGLHDLFKAIGLLKEKGMELSLLVIGDSPFGKSLIPDLKIESKRLGIGNNVSFAGLVDLDTVKFLLGKCSILALTRPSMIQTQAGFPTKLGEYFASKRKIIVTNFGDIEKYFKKDIDVVMAETGNLNEIANKIKWMVENDEAAEAIALSGYKKAILLLEYKINVKKIIDFIN